MAEPTTLSSAETLVAKIVFPLWWLVVFAFAGVALFVADRPSRANPPDGITGLIFLLAFVAGGYAVWRLCVPLKRVRMDERVLYISNFSTEITVPLSEVAEVTESRWVRGHPVTIRFHAETQFGTKVVFIPKQRLLAFPWSRYPVVEEIRRAVANATGSAPAGPVE